MVECLSSYLCNVSIEKDIQDSCDNPMFSGIEEAAIIINRSDIDDWKKDPLNNRIVTDIFFKSGRGPRYIINARNNPFQGTNTTVEVGDYKNSFSRTVSLFVPMDGAEVSQKILDPLANGKFVVILENQYVNDNKDNRFQIYGLDKGLRVSSMTQTKYENNDYWVVELQETGVPNSGRFLIHETETDTNISASAMGQGGDGMSPWLLTFTDLYGNSVSYTFAQEDIVDLSEPVGTWTHYVEFADGGHTYRFYFDTIDSTISGEIFEVEDTAKYICSLMEETPKEPGE